MFSLDLSKNRVNDVFCVFISEFFQLSNQIKIINLNFQSCSLSLLQADIVSKAIRQCEFVIHLVLDLSNNQLENSLTEVLSQSLPHLNNLAILELQLQGNKITLESLRELVLSLKNPFLEQVSIQFLNDCEASHSLLRELKRIKEESKISFIKIY